MKTVLVIALCIPTVAIADDLVRGHVNRDGTYVAPHYRTSPNNTRMDNYSTQGNTNPYTGQQGHVNPYSPPSYGTTHQPAPSIYAPPQPTYNPQPYRNPYGTR